MGNINQRDSIRSKKYPGNIIVRVFLINGQIFKSILDKWKNIRGLI